MLCELKFDVLRLFSVTLDVAMANVCMHATFPLLAFSSNT